MKKLMVGILLASTLLSPGLAASAPPAPQGVASPSAQGENKDLAELNRSVQELVLLLRDYLARQQIEFLFKRVELSLEKMAPLQEELRSLRTLKASDDRELNQLRTLLAAQEALEAQEELKSGETADAVQVVQKVQLEAEIKVLRSRISQTDQKLLELENKLAREQRDVQTWEAAIDQRLGSH